MNLLEADLQSVTRILFARSEDSPRYFELLQHLDASAAEVVAAIEPGQRIWEGEMLESREIVPTAMLRRITSWIIAE